MFELEKIPLEGRRITNHSGKVTMVTNLYNSGFGDNLIRERSGHRSNALDVYKRPSNALLHSVSTTLQPPKPKRTSSCTTTKKM